MRKVIASPFITLDGFIAGPQGELDWAAGGGEFDREMLPLLLKRVDTIVLGRVTYQELAAYWPFASTEDDSNAELMNTVSKLVFSRTQEQVEWGKWGTIRLVKDDPAEVIAHLKQQPGKDMVIFGSGGLVSQLAQAGLVDDYQLRVHSVVLGGGKPLFQDLKEPLKLTLLEATPLSQGVVVLHYQRAWHSVMDEQRAEPSPAERQHQAMSLRGVKRTLKKAAQILWSIPAHSSDGALRVKMLCCSRLEQR